MRSLCLIVAVPLLAGLLAVPPLHGAGNKGASEETAGESHDWYRRAKEAQKAGNVAQAYIYYAQAAALDPDGASDAWLRSLSLRTQALEEIKPLPSGLDLDAETSDPPPGQELLGHIGLADLREAEQPLPPIELDANDTRVSRDFRGSAREIYEKLAPEFGLDVVFDGDFNPGELIRFTLEDADFADAMRIVGAATGTFQVPVSEKLFLVASDTTQKRQDLEPNMAAVVSIPETVSVQEAQELSQAVQQVMDIQKLTVDSERRMVLIRDRISRVRPAQLLFETLLNYRPEVEVEVDFLEFQDSLTRRYGLDLPTSFPISFLGLGASALIPVTGPLSIGMFGLTIGDADLIASMSRNTTRTLLKAHIRSVSGQQATLKVGDRFPIQTTAYIGDTSGGGQVYTPPAQISFEDLGMVLEVTPYVHGNNEVSLHVNAQFKVLGGAAYNGIPVISNRSFETTTRLRTDQWAVMAGLIQSREARAISGLAGVSQIPYLGALFRTTTKEREDRSTLIVLKPRIVYAPVLNGLGPGMATGTETRPSSE